MNLGKLEASPVTRMPSAAAKVTLDTTPGPQENRTDGPLVRARPPSSADPFDLPDSAQEDILEKAYDSFVVGLSEPEHRRAPCLGLISRASHLHQ